MNKIIKVSAELIAIASLLIALLLYVGNPVNASPSISVDTHGTACYQNNNNYTTLITTNQPNEFVGIITQLNTVSPTGLTSNNNLTWHNLNGFYANGNPVLFWTIKPTAGSMNVTITLPDFEHFKSLWFTLTNVNPTNPFDGNPDFSNPNNSNTMATQVTTTNPNDFLVAYATETSSAIPSNTITGINGFTVLDGTNDGCYSQAVWITYYQATTTYTSSWITSTQFTLTNQISGSMIHIQPNTTTSSSSSSTTTTTSSTTTSTTHITRTETRTCIVTYIDNSISQISC